MKTIIIASIISIATSIAFIVALIWTLLIVGPFKGFALGIGASLGSIFLFYFVIQLEGEESEKPICHRERGDKPYP